MSDSPERAVGRRRSAAREVPTHLWREPPHRRTSFRPVQRTRATTGGSMRELTLHTSLESLRKEAKSWLKALRAGDGEARDRLRAVVPEAPDEPGLRDVQLAVAREHGVPGWSALR